MAKSKHNNAARQRRRTHAARQSPARALHSFNARKSELLATFRASFMKRFGG